jgi:hypothetical protein
MCRISPNHFGLESKDGNLSRATLTNWQKFWSPLVFDAKRFLSIRAAAGGWHGSRRVTGPPRRHQIGGSITLY